MKIYGIFENIVKVVKTSLTLNWESTCMAC